MTKDYMELYWFSEKEGDYGWWRKKEAGEFDVKNEVKND
jgi:hypothetical protein